jgi:superfamily II DNA or RNA helicase
MVASQQFVNAPQVLRPYQQDALDAVKSSWKRGVKALVAVATGGGKTTIGSQLLVETIDPYHQRALVIGHTKEIVEQFYNRVENQFGGRLSVPYQVPGALMAPGIGMVMAVHDESDARVVVATRQTAQSHTRMERMLRSGAFDVLLIDEAHHALADNTYGGILAALQEANPFLKVVGFTATPKRTDRKGLGTVFDEIVYEWLIPDGIAAGYLTPVQRVKVATAVNLSGVRTSRGDYSQNKMVSLLETANWLELTEKAYHEYIAETGRRTLAFFPSVEMSKQFAQSLAASGVNARHVDGTTPKPERTDVLKNYVSGDIQVVSNMGVLTEGFDAPATQAVLLARPTRSRTLFTQIVGRGLRPYPGKEDCLLLDLTVVDTKALEIGTLFGRMIQCKECAAQYVAGLPACPRCGATLPPPEERQADDGAIIVPRTAQIGDGLTAEYTSLFEKAFAAWYMGGDGYLSCGMGYDNGALVIMPPIMDEFYRLGHVPKWQNDAVTLLSMNEDLASLMVEAERHLKKIGYRAERTATKDAAWRADMPTRGQMKLLKKLGVNPPTGLTKGSASQLITHALYVDRAATEPWTVQ